METIKNNLLLLLFEFKTALYNIEAPSAMLEYNNPYIKALNIIDRNLTSIEKQIKKL